MNMTTGRRGIVWKTPDITADGLKMFACITMLIQTVGIAIIEKGPDPFRPVYSGESEPGDVSGFPFDDTCGSRIHYAAYRRDGDSRICVSAGRGIS